MKIKNFHEFKAREIDGKKYYSLFDIEEALNQGFTWRQIEDEYGVPHPCTYNWYHQNKNRSPYFRTKDGDFVVKVGKRGRPRRGMNREALKVLESIQERCYPLEDVKKAITDLMRELNYFKEIYTKEANYEFFKVLLTPLTMIYNEDLHEWFLNLE